MQTFANIFEASDYKSVMVTGGDMYSGYVIAREMLKEKHKHFKHVCVGYYEENKFIKLLKKDGAEVIQLCVDDANKIVEVYRKADVVIVVPPVNEHRWGASSVAYVLAAKEAGVKGLVLCSKINAKDMRDMDFLAPLCEMEQAFDRIKDSMDAASLVRCSLHIDMMWLFRHQIASEKKICLSVDPHAKFAPMAMMDGARGLCNMLLDPKHKPGTYELTGPEKLSFKDIAHQMSSAVDKKIEYKQVKHEEVYEYLKKRGEISKNEIEFMCHMLRAVSKGIIDKRTDDLKKLLGEEPMSVKHFLKKSADEFKPKDGE
ncbi:hypothetical protein GGF37_002587 [Kickxella alabastrina]|nr:hypothetical protein GGF37_002587 [Kickxella alabastrina]